jgi:ABC-2 type transport system ATP-binding protein
VVRWRFSRAEPEFLKRLEALEGVREVRSGAEGVDMYADRGGPLIPEVAAAASGAGVEIHDVHISEPSLENLFLHHTGRSLRE